MINQYDLPNFKFRKHTRSPVNLRNLCNTQGVNHLEQRLTFLQTAPSSLAPTPVYLKVLKSGRSLITPKRKSKHKSKTEHKATIKFSSLDASIEFIAMDQFRKGIINEIKQNNSELTPQKLNIIKSNSVQKDLIDLKNFNHHKQVQKQKKELVSRGYLSNAVYSIRAMKPNSKVLVFKKLKTSIPSATRFHGL
jgi:hypothetical protein